MNPSNGIIMFNRGNKMIIHALVSLYSLRKHYQGDVTFYVQNPCDCMEEFKKSLGFFSCNVVHLEDKNEYKTLVMKNSLFENPPYDKTLWIDSDTIINGPIDDMFSYLDEKDVDLCIPSFCGWVSTGHHISARIKRFEGIAEKRHIDEALKEHPSVNTGVLSFKKGDHWAEFVRYWTDYADRGAKKGIFIPDETMMGILLPNMHEWNLKCFIAPTDYNVSPLHDHGLSKDPRIFHFHGNKSCLPGVKTCEYWKNTFQEMCDKNIANINSFLKYADKRLAKYLKDKSDPNFVESSVTIVTAIDEHYLPILKETFPNWRKYKGIDKNNVIVFIYGIDVDKDPRLDFLRLPNVKLIKWDEGCMDKVESHRELMLSAFVFGVADHVKTDYWLKLDADSYATDDRPFITEAMKQYSVFSHKWGYSRPEHVRKLDEWSKTCWHKKISKSTPMIEQGRIEGNRFYHKNKRFISYICLQKTRFTRYCVSLLKERRLPAPSQDTFAYYCIQKLKPEAMGIGNFKKQYGFTQGRGKLGAEHIKKCVEQVDINNANKSVNQSSESSQGDIE